MRVNTSNNQKQRMYLNTETILKFFLGTDDTVDTLIKCKSSEIDLMTSDYELYEALGSLKDYDGFKLNKLIKFLEVVDVVSYRKNKYQEKPILKEEKIDQLRKAALKTN